MEEEENDQQTKKTEAMTKEDDEIEKEVDKFFNHKEVWHSLLKEQGNVTAEVI